MLFRLSQNRCDSIGLLRDSGTLCCQLKDLEMEYQNCYLFLKLTSEIFTTFYRFSTDSLHEITLESALRGLQMVSKLICNDQETDSKMVTFQTVSRCLHHLGFNSNLEMHSNQFLKYGLLPALGGTEILHKMVHLHPMCGNSYYYF